MKYIPPKKLKVLMVMFFGAGIWGMAYGLWIHHPFLTLFGVINFCLGGVFGYRFFTQGHKPEKSSEKRKK
ncbi:MAG TPA: hypothetical protein VNK44_07150 [Candidatus Nitrosotenuis sp.]|nr:hypothetical protein [Candidatus Nitrosotenuis sp.]